MLTLIVRQTLKNGSAKTWKLRSSTPTHTFGSSRLADVISISAQTAGIQGLFEFKDSSWWYISMDMKNAGAGAQSPALRLDQEKSLLLSDCTLQFTPVKKDADLYERLMSVSPQASTLGKSFQLYVVKQSGKIIETKLLPMNRKFRPQMSLSPAGIPCIPHHEWQKQVQGNLEINQRTVSLEDVQRLGHITADQLIDKESKKGAYAVLAAAFLLLCLGLFGPTQQPMEVATVPPRVAQKIIVKNEIKPKRKKTEAMAPSQPKAASAAAATPKNDAPQPGGSRIANMMKSLQNGRVSQLIGKVSAQAAKSGNVVFANGTKAGSGDSGRALAAVGSMEKSGRNWGTEGSGQGVVISTAGRGGGKNASGMGGLTAGGTGNAGVGLIEDESEITGGLDREVIAQYIKSKLGQILYCYERQLSANPELFGKVAVRFTIGPSGAVEQQLIGDTTLKNATVEGCILNRVAAWKFPNPEGGTRVLVTYPFLFKSTN